MGKELRQVQYGIFDFLQNPYAIRDLDVDPENDEASHITVQCDLNGVTGFAVTDERGVKREVNL
jgi:hypothetical protein